jgi:hypothetical protein
MAECEEAAAAMYVLAEIRSRCTRRVTPASFDPHEPGNNLRQS